MSDHRPLKERYVDNVQRGNWPEARYEWDQAHWDDAIARNPFDEIDDKLDELPFLIRRGDIRKADRSGGTLTGMSSSS